MTNGVIGKNKCPHPSPLPAADAQGYGNPREGRELLLFLKRKACQPLLLLEVVN